MFPTPHLPSHHPRGVATLTTSLFILLVMTIILGYTGRTLTNQQKVSANAYRVTQAQAAAQAAFDEAFAYYNAGGADQFNNTHWANRLDCWNNTSPCTSLPDGRLDFSAADADGDGIPDGILSDIAILDGGGAPLGLDLSLAGSAADLTPDGVRSLPAVVNDPDPINAYWFFGTLGQTAPTRPLAITAVGFSDDRQAIQVIRGFAEPGQLLNAAGDGPRQPLLAHGTVGLTGNVTIVNLHFNGTIWSGGSVGIGQSNSASTWISNPKIDDEDDHLCPFLVTIDNYNTNNPNILARNLSDCVNAGQANVDLDGDGGDDYDYDQNCVDNNPEACLHASGRNMGNGVDIIEGDLSLANLSDEQFFGNFFLESKATVEAMIDGMGQRFTTSGDTGWLSRLSQLSGPIWVDTGGTTWSMPANTVIGSLTEPVILIVEGDLRTAANTQVWGLLYVTGEMEVAGSPEVQGAVIVEGDTVDGTGSLVLVYDPRTLDGGAGGFLPPGMAQIRTGTWCDWCVSPLLQ